MQPIKVLKNQFRGINPHLHSLYQKYGGWIEFHNSHVVHLATTLTAQLRPMGYRASIEQSVQVWRSDTEIEAPRADVVVYDTRPARSPQPATTQTAEAREMVLDLEGVLKVMEEPGEYIALSIAPFRDVGRGEPVAWIELLSPTNKTHHQDKEVYRQKRRHLLRSGLVFVELDYLHESPPTDDRLRRYFEKGKGSEPGSHPYRIMVMNPHPSLDEGELSVSQFDVDDPLPDVKIPLLAGEVVKFNFGQPYEKTFDESFFGDDVDYAQLPVNFETYSEFDRARILSRMVAVIRAYRAGDKLEKLPQPIETLSLETAMQQYQQLPQSL